jgi:hypothetical protein
MLATSAFTFAIIAAVGAAAVGAAAVGAAAVGAAVVAGAVVVAVAAAVGAAVVDAELPGIEPSFFNLPSFFARAIAAIVSLPILPSGPNFGKIFFCEKYNHAFLEKILDTNLIYKFYHTKSSNSQGAVLALNSFYSFLKKNSKNLNKYNIVDIGGNDSTFLKMFTNNKEVKVNIDINAVSNNKKIIAVKKPIEKIEKTDIPFLKNNKIYVSSNVLEHLSDPSSLVKFIAKISEEKDEIYFQCSACK